MSVDSMKINSFLASMKNVYFVKGVSSSEINMAQNELNIVFAEEYIAFLRKYGTASIESHEIFGICDSKRLNVVEATQNLRRKCPLLDKDFYVVEDAGIDDVYICQSSDGSIYRVGSDVYEQVKIADSLGNYLKETIEN